VHQQAAVMGYADAFYLLTVFYIGLSLLVVVVKRPKPGAGAGAGH
jgi:DHA2 family multidrug resistance protein